MVAGNWKLNGTLQSAASLGNAVVAGATSLGTEIVLCPTAVHLARLRDCVSGSAVQLGAQNCSATDSGAFTGEISAAMLAEAGCQYVIVGHSERRALFGETSAQVASKCAAVQNAGLTPILCIGETLEQREAGQIDEVLGEQLDAVVDLLGIDAFAQIIVAYEPVWAIGTGKTATPAQAQEVHAWIRQRLAPQAEQLRILYGGSVKPDNAAVLFAEPDIDGGLIGGASLDADAFLAICAAAG